MALVQLLYALAVLLTSCHRIVNAANYTIEVRLADGRYPNQGRVEVRPSGEDKWGSYCSNPNPHPAGRAACRHLGFPALFSATATAEFGLATGLIWFQAAYCYNFNSNEALSSLEECLTLQWFPAYTACDHRFDVGLTCFTGKLRLVGGRKENEGMVEVHLGGDDWVLLAFHTDNGFPSKLADTVCRRLGYPFSVGAREDMLVDVSSRDILCKYGICPMSFDRSRDFFSCIDDVTLHLCSGTGNTSSVGVVCATENTILPIDARLIYHLESPASGPKHKGFVEARYNGSSWKTVCVQVVSEFRARTVADETCRAIGYPWARTFEPIRYSESPGYLSTGDEFVLRELVLQNVRWTLGENACRAHNYELVFVECETGVVVNGLTVWPCASQTCRGRCGLPAENDICGCDAACSRCGDCCYDYSDHCPLQQNSSDAIVHETVASVTGSFACKLVSNYRVIIVHGCSPDLNDTEMAVQCRNDHSSTDLVEYVEGMLFFKNMYCVQCNGITTVKNNSDEDSSSSSSSYWVEDYDVGVDECPPAIATQDIISGCHSYSSIIETSDMKYKNIHCAYCNSVNISAWNYCRIVQSFIFPGHLEVLLGRDVSSWVPETLVVITEGEITCFNKQHQLNVLPAGKGNSSEGNSSLLIQPTTEMTRCFLTTLGWQNIQLTWPFYISFIESELISLVTGGTPEVKTQYLSNVSDFTILLNKTVLPSDEVGSSRDWVVRCGVGSVEFVETCDTISNVTQQGCVDSEFVTKAENLRAFNMSGVQIVYVGDGKLVESKLISFIKTYSYQTEPLRNGDDTKVLVCGELFESAECRLPQVEETEPVSTADGERALMYQGFLFLRDQVVYLPDDRMLICSSAFLASGEPLISFSDPITILNTVGYSLSITALLMTLANYCMFPVLRNVPGGAIMSLSAALLSAQLLTLTVLDKAENQVFCIAMATLLHFLWLSTFTWMNALAFDLMRTFASRQASRPSKKTFLLYCLYGWGVPLLIIASCMTINFTDGESLGFQYGGERSCWVVGKYAVLGAFLVPMACSLVANAILFGWTVHSVHASLVAAAMVHAGKSKSKETLREVWIYFKISCIMGFTWLFGCLGKFVDHQVIWYLFVILNSLQGVFIFVAFGCNLRVRQLWRQRLGYKKRATARKAPNARSSTLCTTVTRAAPPTGIAVTSEQPNIAVNKV